MKQYGWPGRMMNIPESLKEYYALPTLTGDEDEATLRNMYGRTATVLQRALPNMDIRTDAERLLGRIGGRLNELDPYGGEGMGIDAAYTPDGPLTSLARYLQGPSNLYGSNRRW